MDSVKKTLAANLDSLLSAHNMNMSNVADKAKELGYTVHKTTVKRILEGDHNFKAETIDALTHVFRVQPEELLWSKGLDNTSGKPLGYSANISPELLAWCVKKVRLMLNAIDIDNMDFEAQTLSKVICVAYDQGKDAAEIELARQLKNYTA